LRQHREKTKGAIKNGQIRATAYIERKQKAQSKMDKPEQLATCCQLLWFVHF
jgi:hypothetical protein